MNIYDFGKENKNFITDSVLKYFLVSHFRSLPKLFRYIYFNNNYPENQNIKYYNDDSINIIENGLWIIINKEYILDTITLDLWILIYNYYENIKKNNELNNFKNSLICSETFERIEDFIKTYEKVCKGENSLIFSDIKKDIFNVIKYYHNKKKDKPKKKYKTKPII